MKRGPGILEAQAEREGTPVAQSDMSAALRRPVRRRLDTERKQPDALFALDLDEANLLIPHEAQSQFVRLGAHSLRAYFEAVYRNAQLVRRVLKDLAQPLAISL